MPRKLHRFYLHECEPGKNPEAETVQSIMKKEVGDCTIREWRVEDRQRYTRISAKQVDCRLVECVTVAVGYIKDECRRAIRTVMELRLPLSDPHPTEAMVMRAVAETIGSVNIIDWKRENQVQRVENPTQANQGKYSVKKDPGIVVRYMGNGETADKNGKKHRLWFRHRAPDDMEIKLRMDAEVGPCNVLKWYNDKDMEPINAVNPPIFRVIVEYAEKK